MGEYEKLLKANCLSTTWMQFSRSSQRISMTGSHFGDSNGRNGIGVAVRGKRRSFPREGVKRGVVA